MNLYLKSFFFLKKIVNKDKKYRNVIEKKLIILWRKKGA